MRQRRRRIRKLRFLALLTVVGSVNLDLVARCAAYAPAGARGRRPGFLIAAGYETGRRAVTFPQVADAVLVSCDYPLDIPEDLDAGDLWRRLPGLRREIVAGGTPTLAPTTPMAPGWTSGRRAR